MATKDSLTLCTPRDREILAAIARCPLTAELLLKVSESFREPFTNERYLRRRLQLLCAENWLLRNQYATTSRGALNYYTLSPEGFKLLNGPGAPLPSKRYFQPVSPALQLHTMALAEFIVHAIVSAHRVGVRATDFHRESEVQLTLGGECVLPDCCFRLRSKSGKAYNFIVEVDNGTEPLSSKRERESWNRKISFYERYQDFCVKRFRVLIVSTRCTERTDHILQLAAKLSRNPLRRVCYGVGLPDFLACNSGVSEPIWRDHLGTRQSLITCDSTNQPAQSVSLSSQTASPASP